MARIAKLAVGLGLALSWLSACGRQAGNIIVPGGGDDTGGTGGGGHDAGTIVVGDAGANTGQILAQTASVHGLTSDGSYLYWSSGQVLWRVLKTGTAAATMLGSTSTDIVGLFVTATGEPYLTTSDGGVWHMTGGVAVNLGDVLSAGSLVVISGTVFVASATGIQQIQAGFGTTQFTGSVPSGRIIVGPANQLYWAESFTGTGNLVSISANDVPNSEQVVTNDSLGSPVDLTLSGGSLFWTSSGATGALRRAAAASAGDPPTLVLGNLNDPRVIVSDGINLYFSAADYLARVPVTTAGSGVVHAIASGQLVSGIVVDASSVYWENDADGTIRKAPK